AGVAGPGADHGPADGSADPSAAAGAEPAHLHSPAGRYAAEHRRAVQRQRAGAHRREQPDARAGRLAAHRAGAGDTVTSDRPPFRNTGLPLIALTLIAGVALGWLLRDSFRGPAAPVAAPTVTSISSVA